MKNFRQYLMESVKTYKYKVKIAGEPDAKFLQMLEANLHKFDPVSISAVKRTPVQKAPYGFPNIDNQSIAIIDCEFRYPATEPMVKQMVRLLNYDENLVRLIQADYDDSVDKEVEMYANQANPVLDQEEMPDNGKQASQDYGNQYLDKLVPKKPTFNIPFAANPVKEDDAVSAIRKMQSSVGKASPMSKIVRPALPKTGAGR